jgi:proline dehydrogenase
MRIKKRGGSAMVILPKKISITADKPNYDYKMINAFAKAYKWQQAITQDPRLTVAGLAKRENLSGAYVGKILRLNFVSPDIIKTIMDGKQPRGLKLQDFMDNTISDLWEEQKVMFGFSK